MSFYLYLTALNLKPETRSIDLPGKRAVVEIELIRENQLSV